MSWTSGSSSGSSSSYSPPSISSSSSVSTSTTELDLISVGRLWCFLSGHFSPVQTHFPQAQTLQWTQVVFYEVSRYWGLTSHCSQLRSLPRPCISSRWEHKLKIFLSNWKIFSSNSISEIENKWISQGCVVKIFFIAASCKVKQRKCKQIKEFVLQKQSLLKVYRWFIPFP